MFDNIFRLFENPHSVFCLPFNKALIGGASGHAHLPIVHVHFRGQVVNVNGSRTTATACGIAQFAPNLCENQWAYLLAGCHDAEQLPWLLGVGFHVEMLRTQVTFAGCALADGIVFTDFATLCGGLTPDPFHFYSSCIRTVAHSFTRLQPRH